MYKKSKYALGIMAGIACGAIALITLAAAAGSLMLGIKIDGGMSYNLLSIAGIVVALAVGFFSVLMFIKPKIKKGKYTNKILPQVFLILLLIAICVYSLISLIINIFVGIAISLGDAYAGTIIPTIFDLVVGMNVFVPVACLPALIFVIVSMCIKENKVVPEPPTEQVTEPAGGENDVQ